MTLRCTAGPLASESLTIESELVLGRDQSEVGRLRGIRGYPAATLACSLTTPAVPRSRISITNGTWVNGERLTGPRMLSTGDELRAGQTTFAVEVPPAAVATLLNAAPPVAVPPAPESPPGAAVNRPRRAKQGEEIPLGDSC